MSVKTQRKTKARTVASKGGAVKKVRGSVPKTTSRSNGKYPLTVYEHLHIGIVETSLDGKYIDANTEFCRILGYSKKELLQLGIRDCTHEDDYSIDIKLHEQLIRGEIPFYGLEKRFVRKDGGIVWVELTRSLVLDEGGKPICTIGAVLDISDRKQVERALRESVESLRLATEAARMFKWELDFQKQTYTFADNFVQVLGFSAGLLSQNSVEAVWKLSPPEDAQVISEAIAKAVESHRDLYSLQYRMINPEDGRVVWLEANAKVVYDETGNARRMFGVAQNITHNKETQDEIRVVSRMPEENPNPVMRLTPDGRISYANPASAPLLESWKQDTDPVIPDGLQKAVVNALATRMKTEVEIEHRERVFSCTLAPVTEFGYVNLYGKDITERKRAEQALAEYARQQEALYRLSDELHHADSLESVYDAALNAILNGLQCDRASILLFDDTGVMRFVAWRGLSDGYRKATEGHSPWTAGEKNPYPVCISDIHNSDLSDSLKATILAEGINSLVFIPLVLYGKLIGKFMVYFSEHHECSDVEVELSLMIARQLAFGIDRKRAEERLRANEALYRAIARSIPGGGVYVVDKDFRYLVAEGPVTEAFGLRREMLEGHRVSEVFPDDRGKRMEDRLRRNFAGETVSFETEYNGRVYWTQQAPLLDSIGQAIVLTIDITERKQAEEALRIENERFMRFVNSNIVGILIGDTNGKVVLANDYYLRLLGVSRQDLTEGKVDWKQFTPPEWLSADEKAIQELRERGVCEPYEKEYVRADGTRVPVYVADAMLPGSGEEIAAFVLDITERKQAEEALRQSEERFARFMQHLPGLAWIKDVQGRYVFANTAAEKAFGTPREKLYGKTDTEIFPPEVAVQFRQNDEQALTSPKGVQTVETLPQEDGVLHYSLVTKFPIPGPHGNIALIGGTAFDITERLQAERSLRESEERLRAILSQATAGIVRKDAKGRFIFVNQAYCDMLGYTEAELLGKAFWEFTYVEDIEENKQLYNRLMSEGIPFKLEKRLIRRDGSMIWVDVSISPVMDAEGKPTSSVGVEVDITGRKQAEDALRRNEKMFSTLVDAAPFGVYFIDSEFRLRSINKGSEPVFSGIYPLIGRDFAEILHIIWQEPFATEAIEHFRHTLRTGESFISPPVVEARANIEEIQAYDWQIHRMTLSDGTFGVVCYFYDLSEQMRMEAAVRASEERYRSLFDLVPVAVYSCDANGLIQEYNHRAIELWGREPAKNDPSEKFCGSFRLLYPDGRFMPSAECPMARVLKGEILEPHEFEMLSEREDGERRSVVAHPLLLRNKLGEITGAINCLYDITARKQAEEALQQLNLQLENRVQKRTATIQAINQSLREEIAERKRIEEALRASEATTRASEEKLRTLFDLLPVGITFLDPEGKILQMNSALPEIVKLSREQLFSQTYKPRKYIRADGTPMPSGEFASARALRENKTIYNVETGIILETGEVVWTSVSAAPVDVADVGVVIVTVNITDSKRAEQDLKDSHRRLSLLSRRLVEVQEEERRALARELHDRVGQTLAALNINLIIINSQLSPEAAQQIGARLNDSMKLVAETIALVRDVMTDLRPAVLDDYGLEAALESQLGKFTSRYNIKAVFEKSDRPIPRLGPSVEMTFLRIAQEALMNIARHSRAETINLALRQEEDTICLSIRDDGIGIESWQEANRPGSHGLTIMRERADAFGGRLKVSSVPGVGTTVEVMIPFKNDDRKKVEDQQL